MGKEVNADKKEMPKVGNYEVKIIIMDQCSVDLFRYLDILNLIFRKK